MSALHVCLAALIVSTVSLACGGAALAAIILLLRRRAKERELRADRAVAIDLENSRRVAKEDSDNPLFGSGRRGK